MGVALGLLLELRSDTLHEHVLVREECDEARLVGALEPALGGELDAARVGTSSGRDERDESLFIFTLAVRADVLDEIASVNHGVRLADQRLLLGGAVDEHGDETPVVVAEPAVEGLLEVNGDLLLPVREEAHERIPETLGFKDTGGLALESQLEVLAVRRVVLALEQLELLLGLVAEDADDGLLVGAHALDGVAENLDVRVVIGVSLDVIRVLLDQGAEDVLEVAADGPLALHVLGEVEVV